MNDPFLYMKYLYEINIKYLLLYSNNESGVSEVGLSWTLWSILIFLAYLLHKYTLIYTAVAFWKVHSQDDIFQQQTHWLQSLFLVTQKKNNIVISKLLAKDINT
jgi:hypothetical protein